MATVVTAFVQLDGYDPQNYLNNGKKLLSTFEESMLIFIDEKFINLFENRSANDEGKWGRLFMPFKLEDIPAYQQIDEIRANYPRNYDKNYPNPNKTDTPEYITMMLGKFWCMKCAVEMNPYDTDKFMWIDFGIYKNPKIFIGNLRKTNNELVRIAEQKSQEKLHLCCMRPVCKKEFETIGRKGIYEGHCSHRIACGIMTGNRKIWKNVYDWVNEEFTQALSEKLIGVDEIIMAMVAFLHRDFFKFSYGDHTTLIANWFCTQRIDWYMKAAVQFLLQYGDKEEAEIMMRSIIAQPCDNSYLELWQNNWALDYETDKSIKAKTFVEFMDWFGSEKGYKFGDIYELFLGNLPEGTILVENSYGSPNEVKNGNFLAWKAYYPNISVWDGNWQGAIDVYIDSNGGNHAQHFLEIWPRLRKNGLYFVENLSQPFDTFGFPSIKIGNLLIVRKI